MKINILFNINKRKLNNKGLCVLMCRITYNKVRKTFSTGLFINQHLWHSKQQHVNPPEPDADYINSQLSLIRTKLLIYILDSDKCLITSKVMMSYW